MGSPNSVTDEEDHFYDALDDFPFHDCSDLDLGLDHPEPQPSSTPATLRRRRFQKENEGEFDEGGRSGRVRFRSGAVRAPLSVDSERNDELSTITEVNKRDCDNSSDSVAPGPATDGEEKAHEASVITAVDRERVGDWAESVGGVSETEAVDSSLLISLAAFVIKAIGFQFNLLFSMLTFPFWCFYTFFMFIMDPFATMFRGREYLSGKLMSAWNWTWEAVSPFMSDWLKERQSVWELALKCGWALFWSIYVCSILFGLLVCATLLGGFIMRYLVEEPIRMEQKLNLDYTKNCPVAYMPIGSCDAIDCGVKCKEMIGFGNGGRGRVIPANHKLLATVKLTLPESDYNRNLGVFQVRVDFLSANGEILSSSSHPCMLLFKSEPVRLLLTVLKVAPLIAGYISESQTIDIKFRGFTESSVPTACIKVVVEQRAEFRPGAGIPEIYDASVTLESELPLLKRLLWYWKKTVFIWVCMVLFTIELLFTLICCRAVILPRTWRRDSFAGNHAS